jgi:non-ribosomal peptide synthetase component F
VRGHLNPGLRLRPRNLLSRLVICGGAVALMAPAVKQACTPSRLALRFWLTDEEKGDANVITDHRYLAVIEARRQSLSDLLRRSAARFGDKAAVVDGDVSFSFAELNAAVTSTAAALQHRGIVKGDREWRSTSAENRGGAQHSVDQLIAHLSGNHCLGICGMPCAP